MSQVERRFRLIFDQSVAADLSHVKRLDVEAHAEIYALLEEYSNGTFPAEELIDEHFSSDEIENVSPFWHLQEKGLNAYRLKLVTVRSWRILTAGDHRYREVAVLAIMHRDQDYQSDKALMNRIEKSYENFGFHRLGK